jgi:UDP-3-O-[3-hydroxymyristoyl] glucosamine N-acyltransferase
MIKLKEIAASIHAELLGSEDVSIACVASISGATAKALVFAEDEASLEQALRSGAGAVVLTKQLAEQAGTTKPLLVMKQPRLGFARAARLLRGREGAEGVHPAAVLHPGVEMDDDVAVDACAVIQEDVHIGSGTTVGAGAVIGAGVQIGRNCHIYPRVVLYPGVTLGDRVIVHAGAVLGADGFGYVRDAATGEYLQFPQQGTLVIEDDVEIGANTTIDRGALEETRIARGAKLDNLIHIGHNVGIGRNVVIAAQTGISGSSSVGNDAVIGGQVGMGDHATVGEKVILGSGSGVLPHKNLRGPGIVFWGIPARPLRQYLKELATLTRLTRTSSKKEE